MNADCELRDGWFLDQDVNAWTSLAYLAVGFVIVAIVVRRRLPRALLALGVVAAVEGVGSLLYHGGEGDLAQLLHDVPLVGALGFIAGWQAGRLFDRAGAGALAGLAVGLAAGAIASTAGGTNVAVAIFVIVVAASELLARRRRVSALWTVPLLALTAVAAAVWLAGTSDSPLCDEQSWAQPHGAWHVLSALVLLAWFAAASGDRSVLTTSGESAAP